MATDHGLIFAAATAAAATGAAASGVPFIVHFVDFGVASFYATIGIVARHAYDASRAGSFDLKGLCFDLLTAPMLGICLYIACLYWQIIDPVPVLIIVFGSFLGPEWLRKLGELLIGVLIKRFDTGGKG